MNSTSLYIDPYLPDAGIVLLFQTGLILCHALIDFIFLALTGVAKFFLKQTGEDVVIAGDTIKISVSNLTPPHFGLASHLFPLAVQCISINGLFLQIL